MTADTLTKRTAASVHLQCGGYDASDVSKWRTWLSKAERGRMTSFGAVTRRHEFLLGRALARGLLGGCLDVPPAEVSLCRAEDDGLDVEEEGWFVSIAHSEEEALVGAAPHHIGVDLEAIRSRDAAVADFLFAPEDRGIVERLPYDFDAALVLCWSLKESVLKARRSGFRRSPKELRMSVAPEKGEARVRVEEGRVWTVAYARMGDFWGTVAIPELS